jgi:hypothetical protein
MTTKDAFNAIIDSELFRLRGPKINLPDALIDLARAINAEDETDWSLGECLECSLDSLIIGAYWSTQEWHGGQSSPEYAAFCALSSIFSPGMSGPPESSEDGPEWESYEACNRWFEERHANAA